MNFRLDFMNISGKNMKVPKLEEIFRVYFKQIYYKFFNSTLKNKAKFHDHDT